MAEWWESAPLAGASKDEPWRAAPLADAPKQQAPMVPGFDFTPPSSTPLWTRFQMGRQDNPEELRKYMDKKFGVGGWLEKEGEYYLTADTARKHGYETRQNLPVALNTKGLDWGDAAEFMGSSGAPLAGGIAAGALTGGAGFIPGVLAAGAGAGGGELINEGIKSLEGTQSKTGAEIAQDAGFQALTNAAGEGVFRIATPFLSKFLGPTLKRPLSWGSVLFKREPLQSTVSTDSPELLREAFKQGYQPSVSSATNSRWLGMLQSMHDHLMGSGREEANTLALTRGMNDLRGTFGSKPVTAKEMAYGTKIDDIVEKAGQDTVSAVDKVLDPTDLVLRVKAADQLAGEAENRLKDSVFKGLANKNPAVGQAVKDDLNTYTKMFYGQAREGYALLDRMAGGATINVGSIKATARKYLESGPIKTIVNEAGEEVKVPINVEGEQALQYLRKIVDMDDVQTAADLIDLRQGASARLSDKALPGVPDHILRDIVKSADNALDSAAEAGTMSPDTAAYYKGLRSWYREGIDKLDRYEVQALLSDPSRASYIGADRVVDFVSNLKSVEQINGLRGILPDKTWQQVQRGVWDNTLRDASGPDDVVDAKRLAQYAYDNQEKLVAVYGQDQANKISTYAKFLAAKGGKIDLANVPQGDPYTILRKAASEKQALDDFYAKAKDIKDLVVSGKDPVDFIPNMLADKSPQRIMQLQELLGKDSEAWKNFQAASMEHLLRPMVGRSENASGLLFHPERVDELLKGQSPTALKALFGEETYQGLVNFSRIARFSMAQGSLKGGWLAAAYTFLHPISHASTIANFMAMGKLMNSPTFLRWMTGGMKDGFTRDSLRFGTRMVAQTAAQVGAGDVYRETEQPQ